MIETNATLLCDHWAYWVLVQLAGLLVASFQRGTPDPVVTVDPVIE